MSSTDATLAPTRDLTDERWVPVVGYELRYEVSDLGRVWSLKNNKPLRPGPTSKGYLTVCLYDGSSPKQPRSFCVHDLVAAAFIGPKPQGLQVDHGRLGKQCNIVANLEYVTGQENCKRAVRDGLIIPPNNRYQQNQTKKRKSA